MPLPKLPTKPAALLLAQDYPKADRSQPAGAAFAPPKPKLAAVSEAAPEVISKPAAKTTRAKPVAAAPVAAAPLAAVPEAVAAPVEALAPAAKPASRGKEKPHADPEALHPGKHKPVEMMVKSKASRNADRSGMTKLFVLDTNVLMHDPSSLFRFEEHDVYLPMMTLEELDDHKKGMSEVARNARQV